MTHSTHFRTSSDDGFTLIELLVVILIIGILAAIALPAFLGQRSKAQDSNAKANARNLASQIETCWLTNQTYVGCSAVLATDTSLPYGTGVAQVQVVDALTTTTGYQITAMSKAADGGQHTFTIVHNIGGVFSRQCAPADKGGCRADGTW